MEVASMAVPFGAIQTVHDRHWPQHCWVPISRMMTLMKKMTLMKMTVLYRAIHRYGINAQRICRGMVMAAAIWRVVAATVVPMQNQTIIQNHIHSRIARERRTMGHNTAIGRFKWVRTMHTDGPSTIHTIQTTMGLHWRWAANNKRFDALKMANRTWN